MDRGLGADEHGGLPVGVAGGDDLLVGGQRGGVAARSGEPVMGGQQRVDVAGELHAGVDEHDEVVADALQVGDQVGGQDDAELVLGDGLHEVLQELAVARGGRGWRPVRRG